MRAAQEHPQTAGAACTQAPASTAACLPVLDCSGSVPPHERPPLVFPETARGSESTLHAAQVFSDRELPVDDAYLICPTSFEAGLSMSSAETSLRSSSPRPAAPLVAPPGAFASSDKLFAAAAPISISHRGIFGGSGPLRPCADNQQQSFEGVVASATSDYHLSAPLAPCANTDTGTGSVIAGGAAPPSPAPRDKLDCSDTDDCEPRVTPSSQFDEGLPLLDGGWPLLVGARSHIQAVQPPVVGGRASQVDRGRANVGGEQPPVIGGRTSQVDRGRPHVNGGQLAAFVASGPPTLVQAAVSRQESLQESFLSNVAPTPAALHHTCSISSSCSTSPGAVYCDACAAETLSLLAWEGNGGTSQLSGTCQPAPRLTVRLNSVARPSPAALLPAPRTSVPMPRALGYHVASPAKPASRRPRAPTKNRCKQQLQPAAGAGLQKERTVPAAAALVKPATQSSGSARHHSAALAPKRSTSNEDARFTSEQQGALVAKRSRSFVEMAANPSAGAFLPAVRPPANRAAPPRAAASRALTTAPPSASLRSLRDPSSRDVEAQGPAVDAMFCSPSRPHPVRSVAAADVAAQDPAVDAMFCSPSRPLPATSIAAAASDAPRAYCCECVLTGESPSHPNSRGCDACPRRFCSRHHGLCRLCRVREAAKQRAAVSESK